MSRGPWERGIIVRVDGDQVTNHRWICDRAHAGRWPRGDEPVRHPLRCRSIRRLFFLASDKNRLSTEKVQSLLKLRIAALDYRNDPTTDRALDVRGRLNAFLAEARAFGQDLSEDQLMLDAALADIEEYAVLFDRMANLQSGINDLIIRLDDTSSLFAGAIKSIQHMARVDGAGTIGNRTGKAYQAFILIDGKRPGSRPS